MKILLTTIVLLGISLGGFIMSWLMEGTTHDVDTQFRGCLMGSIIILMSILGLITIWL
jgi:hypothetical protein